LELLLYFAIPRRDTNPLAHRLINQFGSLDRVLSASAEDLQTVPGIGASAAALLTLVPQLARRAALTAGRERILDTTDALGTYFMELLTGNQEERCYLVCMDAKGKQLSCRLLSQGTAFATGVSVRTVTSHALQSGAAMVALGHNHPSGVAFPSQEDLAATAKLKEALAAVDIRLADHIIVADRDYTSMRLSGLL
jgi:DNA repair protein RadC